LRESCALTQEHVSPPKRIMVPAVGRRTRTCAERMELDSSSSAAPTTLRARSRASRAVESSAEAWPARRPKPTVSARELPPSRLAPCSPAVAAPAAYSPATSGGLGVGSTTTRRVVGGGADLCGLLVRCPAAGTRGTAVPAWQPLEDGVLSKWVCPGTLRRWATTRHVLSGHPNESADRSTRVYPALPGLLGWQPSRFLNDWVEAERPMRGPSAGQHERRRHPVGQHLAVAAQSLQPPRPGHAHPQPGSGTAAGGRRRPASAPASRSPRRWMRCLSPLIEFRQWLPETVIGKVLRRELRTDEQGASPRMGSRTEVRGPDLLERLAPTRKPVTDGEFRSHPGTGPSSPAGR
jgi:hypothetical protein